MPYILLRMSFDSHYYGLFDGINLGIHEGGHLLFRPFGEFLCIADGTICQLAAPGVSIRSSLPGGGYAAWNGTSMAWLVQRPCWPVMRPCTAAWN